MSYKMMVEEARACRAAELEYERLFMPLALGGLADFSAADIQRIGVVWEWISAAGPRAINGYPRFFSCRFMDAEDFWTRAVPAIKAEEARRKEIKV
jgi:hypothetical protein